MFAGGRAFAALEAEGSGHVRGEEESDCCLAEIDLEQAILPHHLALDLDVVFPTHPDELFSLRPQKLTGLPVSQLRKSIL